MQELARQSWFTHNVMNDKPSFFSELRRRNVFRVALTYAVVAWLLIEIASVLLPLVDAPESIITAFVVLLALGFAVALFISWAFEMTPEGLKRTQDLSPEEVIPYWSRRKFATFIFGVAGIAFCLSAYHLLFPAPARNLSQSEPISTSSPSSSPPEKSTGTQSVERLLRDLDAQWAKAAEAKDVEQTIAFYSDDAIVLPPNATSAATKEAIRNGWKEMFASPGFVISWQPTRVQVGKAGEMAWVRGTYELTMNDASGKPINDRGKYLEVWEKQTDGNWKCAADMWNSDLAASAP
jgi:ketosteroid isomerase-like protein